MSFNSRVLTFGELILWLKTPGRERFLQSPVSEVTLGGGEANVAVPTACLALFDKIHKNM